MYEAIQLLIGIKQPLGSSLPDGFHPPKPTFTQGEDIFWSNLDHLRVVEDIERAILERNELNDVPSFSLGLTQDFMDVGIRDVVSNIASKCRYVDPHRVDHMDVVSTPFTPLMF